MELLVVTELGYSFWIQKPLALPCRIAVLELIAIGRCESILIETSLKLFVFISSVIRIPNRISLFKTNFFRPGDIAHERQ